SETNLSKEMESVMKDIKNTTQKKYRDYSKTPGSPDNDFLFMYSVARFVNTKCIDLIYIPLMKEHMLVSARFLSTNMKSLSLLPC
ncbi:hypothetical protein Celaphus_00015787, partial [Cervus elaphus hippelaphus]